MTQRNIKGRLGGSIIIAGIAPLYIFSQSLIFNANLFLGVNSGMQTTYSNIYFQYGGNQQAGVFFRKGLQTVSPAVTVTVGSLQLTGCTKKVAGMYYNPIRGNRVRPIDSLTLNQLQLIDSSYNQLTLSGGFYTNCQNTNSGAIYGYVQHTWNSTTYDMIAGVQIMPSFNSYLPVFDQSLLFNITTTRASGYIFDPLGGVGWVTVPPVCGDSMILLPETCDDGNLTGGDGCNVSCQTETSRQCSGQPSICIQITQPGTGSTSGFNARLQFPSLYTNTQFINGLVYVSEAAGYTIAGNTQGTFAGTINSAGYVNIILSTGDGLKTLTTRFISLATGIVMTGTTQITLDTTIPTATILNPTSGSITTGSFTATRSGQDTNGIQNTIIQIYKGTSLVYSNMTNGTSLTISTLSDGIYILIITVIDAAGNTTQKTTTFTVNNSTQSATRTITNFNQVTGADINTYYTSNPVIIAGLATGISITGTINTGEMIINNVLFSGMTATVTNGDIIKMIAKSSNQYLSTMVARLTINGSVLPFSITTKNQSGDALNQANACANTRTYGMIFLALRSNYANDDTKFIEVLEVLLKMIDDRIKIGANNGGLSIYSLQCLYDIVDKYIIDFRTNINPDTNQGIYTAPNGKQYHVQFIEDRNVYSSPDFLKPKYFASYATLTKHIDGNNPKITRSHTIDANFKTVTHTAPNGKQYVIQKTNKGYMSYKLLKPTYFPTLQDIKSYINQRNPK